MPVVVVGVSHQSAPVALRERLAFRAEQLPETYACLRKGGLEKAAVLSTCNRVEIYTGTEKPQVAMDYLEALFCERSALSLETLRPSLYRLEAPRSVRHLFYVASGLDSMVLGESEILGQVKVAYEIARNCGATDKLLNGLFQRALNTAKAVRTETGLERVHASVGSVAVDLSGKIFGNVKGRTIALVGAGEVAALTLKRLQERGASRVRILNRSLERAVLLAQQFGGSAMGLNALPEILVDADVVLFSASVEKPLASRDLVAKALAVRHQRPLCLVDLGVPRNVESTVSELDNVYLFNIDDLEGLREQSLQQNRGAVEASHTLIERKVEHFLKWWQRETCASESEAAAAV